MEVIYFAHLLFLPIRGYSAISSFLAKTHCLHIAVPLILFIKSATFYSRKSYHEFPQFNGHLAVSKGTGLISA